MSDQTAGRTQQCELVAESSNSHTEEHVSIEGNETAIIINETEKKNYCSDVCVMATGAPSYPARFSLSFIVSDG